VLCIIYGLASDAAVEGSVYHIRNGGHFNGNLSPIARTKAMKIEDLQLHDNDTAHPCEKAR
jgi:hypothetical protein